MGKFLDNAQVGRKRRRINFIRQYSLTLGRIMHARACVRARARVCACTCAVCVRVRVPCTRVRARVYVCRVCVRVCVCESVCQKTCMSPYCSANDEWLILKLCTYRGTWGKMTILSNNH